MLPRGFLTVIERTALAKITNYEPIAVYSHSF